MSRKSFLSELFNVLKYVPWCLPLTAFFPFYALEHGMSNPGLLFAAFAVMLILGRMLGGRGLDLYSREKVILPCLLTYIIATSLLAFSKTTPMFILAAVIWGLETPLLSLLT